MLAHAGQSDKTCKTYSSRAEAQRPLQSLSIQICSYLGWEDNFFVPGSGMIKEQEYCFQPDRGGKAWL